MGRKTHRVERFSVRRGCFGRFGARPCGHIFGGRLGAGGGGGESRKAHSRRAGGRGGGLYGLIAAGVKFSNSASTEFDRLMDHYECSYH